MDLKNVVLVPIFFRGFSVDSNIFVLSSLWSLRVFVDSNIVVLGPMKYLKANLSGKTRKKKEKRKNEKEEHGKSCARTGSKGISSKKWS